MKSGRKVLLLLTLVLALSVGTSKAVWAAGYTHEEGTNVYQVTQTGGNVTDAVKAALEAADGSAAVQTIRLQPGTYQVGAISIKKSNILLDLTGVTLESDGTANHILRIADQAVSNITVKGGSFDGKNKVQMVFFISGVKGRIANLTLENCDVSGGKETNVRIEAVDGLVLDHIKVHDSGYGLLALDCTGIKAGECKADGNNFGLAFRSAKGELINCTATGNKTDGLQVKDKGTDISVYGGSYCKNGKNGISLTSGASMQLSGAEVSLNDGNGISPVGAKGKNTVLTAKNTNFNSNGRHGVAAALYVTTSITDCKADHNAVNGFFLNTHCTGKVMKNVEANENGACGILVQGVSGCTRIEKAVCDQNGKLGISLENVQTTVEESSISNNKKHGLFLSGKAKKTVTVRDCTINGNKTNGIMTSGNKVVDVKTSTLLKNGNCGIESKDCTIKLTGEGNQIEQNQKHGVVCRNGKLFVKQAVVRNNRKNGIFYEGCSDGYCLRSVLEGNQTGVVLAAGAQVKKINGNTFQNNSKYNLMLYAGKGKQKTTLKACSKNKFYTKTKNGMQVYFEKNTKKPVKLKAVKGKAKKDRLGNIFALKKK